MTTIATEISRIQSAKAWIKTSIEWKWVSVPSDAKIDAYPSYIDQISWWVSYEEYERALAQWTFWRYWQTSRSGNLDYNKYWVDWWLATWEWWSRDWTVYHIFSFWMWDTSSSGRSQYPFVVHLTKEVWTWFNRWFTRSTWTSRDRSSSSLSDWQYSWIDRNYWVRAKYNWDKNIDIVRWWQWDYIVSRQVEWWAWNQINISAEHNNSETIMFVNGWDNNEVYNDWIANCWISDSELVTGTNYIQSLTIWWDNNNYYWNLTLK